LDPEDKDFKNRKEKNSLHETSAVLESEIEEEKKIRTSMQQGSKKTQQIKKIQVLIPNNVCELK
jgi:hypothetical protein